LKEGAAVVEGEGAEDFEEVANALAVNVESMISLHTINEG
jgi:hypothetical protein